MLERRRPPHVTENGARPPMKKMIERQQIAGRQHREAGQWRTLVPVETRWDAPNAASASAEFGLFVLAIFDQPIRRIGDNRVNAVWSASLQPREAI